MSDATAPDPHDDTLEILEDIREGMNGIPPHHYELEHRSIPQYPRPIIATPPWVRHLLEDPPVVGEDDRVGHARLGLTPDVVEFDPDLRKRLDCNIIRPRPNIATDRKQVAIAAAVLLLVILAAMVAAAAVVFP